MSRQRERTSRRTGSMSGQQGSDLSSRNTSFREESGSSQTENSSQTRASPRLRSHTRGANSGSFERTGRLPSRLDAVETYSSVPVSRSSRFRSRVSLDNYRSRLLRVFDYSERRNASSSISSDNRPRPHRRESGNRPRSRPRIRPSDIDRIVDAQMNRIFSGESDEEAFIGFPSSWGDDDDDDEDDDGNNTGVLYNVLLFVGVEDIVRDDFTSTQRDDCLSDYGDADDPYLREMRGSLPEPKMSLHAACVRGNTDELKCWRAWKVGSVVKGTKDSPMHCAARAGDVGAIMELIEQGVSVTSYNDYDLTPLEIAARHGHKGVVKLLLDSGACPDEDELDRAYDASRCWGVIEILRQFETTGINRKNSESESHELSARWVKKLLFRAVQKGQVEILHGLLKLGVNSNSNGILGWTPLHVAARRGHLLCLIALLKSGADVKETDNKQWTPLHHAAKEGHLKIIKALLKAGADINAKCGLGRKPVDVASDRKVRRFLKRLKK